MKNEILDDIFKDKLRDQLVEGEIIVWDGKPRFSNYSRLVAFFFIIFFFGIYLYSTIVDKKYWLTLFIVLGITYSLFNIFLKQKKTRYLITNQRIIFQLPKMRKVEIQSLPLNQLEEVVVKEKVNKNGTLEFILKEPFKTKIKTIDIRNSYPREHPTMEIIENVLEVKNYIEKGIKGEL
ncbi:MAG: PH domain-containing protein [Saprospiraceae bacterium]